MTGDLLLAIDQGTSSTRAICFDRALRPVATAARPLATRHPRAGWVEQDPDEILASVVESVSEVLRAVGGPERIAAAGLDNQGETVVAWDGENGAALAPAVSWQCNRSAQVVERLRAAGREPAIRRRTGLPLDPYFSAGKMTWLLEEVPAVAAAARSGALRLGTVDAWLSWHLAGEGLTDPSTASRTQLLDLETAAWSDELLGDFCVPAAALPRIRSTVGPPAIFAHRAFGELPVTAFVCDQQAALAGHACFEAGAIKATYGTGVFVLATTGPVATAAGSGLLSTIAWQLAGDPVVYALDGGVFTAGALLDWLRGALGLVGEPAASADLARSVADTAGVRVLPAIAGLGAPWWRPEARGVISGLSAAAGRAHIVRAAFDGLAHRVADIVEASTVALDRRPDALRVDGGLTGNDYLMQRQADLLGLPVDVAAVGESTALGTAGLAGIGAGLLDPAAIARANPVGRRYVPRLGAAERGRERAAWTTFVERAVALEGPTSAEPPDQAEPAQTEPDGPGRGRAADR